ncbi:hypothetical protein I302_107459 [Kwoniella bestiolae CBS 10118]|uniref:Uncharacterized protein n=1 Tax=Kwoniella bestiolae CBS 10118 TaxID=1296100 RepID=A0A1B9FYG6_9TREE|nr:hypothetical protein I302_06800 [Kwoniella bestiolae CBS 10118]OCF23816.1 hypothetical protein I302_06800 [Kwoniella bestiolae CBS 10118]
MKLLLTSGLLVTLGLTCGATIKRDDEDTHDFKMVFGEKTGYSAINKTDGIVKGPTSETWTWKESEAGNGDSSKSFDFHTYKNKDDEELKDKLKFSSVIYHDREKRGGRNVQLICKDAKNQTEWLIDSEEDLY